MIDRLRKYTRQRRWRIFQDYIQSFPRPIRIIDLGGTVRFWEDLGTKSSDQLEITLINNFEMDRGNKNQLSRSPFIVDHRADALSIKYDDFKKFDLIFSNSFLEHLTSRADQDIMASNIDNSQVPYFIQVPNKNAPVDPHFPHPLVPFFATYPRALQAKLLTIGEFKGGWKAASVEAAIEGLRYYNPLGLADMRRLFPHAELTVERPFGVPMSILAIKRRHAVAAHTSPLTKSA